MSSSCSYFQSLPIHQLEEIYYRDIQKSENAPSLVDDARNLVEWLKTQLHLSHIEMNQSYVMSILLIRKGFEKAKKHLEFHFTCRAVYPEYFIHWDPSTPQFQYIYDRVYVIPSKVPTPDGDLIWLIGLDNMHINILPTVHDVIREATMLMTHAQYYSLSKAGILIIDCKNITYQVIQIFLVNIPKVLPSAMKMNAARVSKIYVLHPFPMLATIISLMKNIPVLSKKIADRIEAWNRNVNELVSVLPAEHLPCDYGGSLPSIDEQRDEFYKHISQQRDWFMNECQKKARLDLRPKTIDDEDDLFGFGVDGTFRQLSVD